MVALGTNDPILPIFIILDILLRAKDVLQFSMFNLEIDSYFR